MKAIDTIFTTEDQKELKISFKEIICEEFKNQLNTMDIYLFDPGDIEETISEAFKEIIDEIKSEFKTKLKEQMLKLLENNDLETLIGLSKK
jgi:hypothetical protein